MFAFNLLRTKNAGFPLRGRADASFQTRCVVRIIYFGTTDDAWCSCSGSSAGHRQPTATGVFTEEGMSAFALKGSSMNVSEMKEGSITPFHMGRVLSLPYPGADDSVLDGTAVDVIRRAR